MGKFLKEELDEQNPDELTELVRQERMHCRGESSIRHWTGDRVRLSRAMQKCLYFILIQKCLLERCKGFKQGNGMTRFCQKIMVSARRTD